jgi:ubiquinone/menaquinone biosynthesis C-methylase UbiE
MFGWRHFVIQYVSVDQATISQIQSSSHFKNSIYRSLDIEGTLEYFHRRYVNPLQKWFDISNSVVVDCGAGYGWFSIAYLLAGGLRVIAADPDTDRLRSAEEIARLFAVDNRMEFLNTTLETLPMSTDEADIFVSIETLEHVGKENILPALQHMKQIASQGILITTPNKLFPAIAHDTRLPFAHWLSPSARQSYANLFGRGSANANNAFVSPRDLNSLADKFKPVSSCLTFSDFEEYKSHFPYYLPYGKNEAKRIQNSPSPMKAAYFKYASKLFGTNSYWVMPSLATIFVRNS